MDFNNALDLALSKAASFEAAQKIITDLTAEISAVINSKYPELYLELDRRFLRLRSGFDERAVCEVELDEGGFPVEITTAIENNLCNDEESLRLTLLEIFSSGHFGRQLIALSTPKP